MEKHDKIYVPCGYYDKNQCGYVKNGEHNGATVKENIDVIVLTIEELRQVWRAAERRIEEENRAERSEEPELVESPDFEGYLQSKGIQP